VQQLGAEVKAVALSLLSITAGLVAIVALSALAWAESHPDVERPR